MAGVYVFSGMIYIDDIRLQDSRTLGDNEFDLHSDGRWIVIQQSGYDQMRQQLSEHRAKDKTVHHSS